MASLAPPTAPSHTHTASPAPPPIASHTPNAAQDTPPAEDRMISINSDDGRSLSCFVPSWERASLEQGMEDAEMTLKLKSSLDCSTIRAHIRGYKTRGPGSSDDRPHVEFEIEVITALSSWRIERRYRDFEYLQKQLRAVHSRASLPALPGKRYLGSSFDQGFLDERARLLEEYLANLIIKSEIWSSKDLVNFLDGDNNILTFIWNFGRMREMSMLLSAVQVVEENTGEGKAAEEKSGEGKVEETLPTAVTLESKLRDAKEELKTLQARIARMEMVFLQNAAGVAEQDLPQQALRRLTGDGDDFKRAAATEISDPDEEHEPSAENDSVTPDRSCSFSELSTAKGSIVTTSSFMKALGLSRRKQSSIQEFRAKAHSVDDIDVYRISMEIREALNLSNDMLEDSCLNDFHRPSSTLAVRDETSGIGLVESWTSDVPASAAATSSQQQLLTQVLQGISIAGTAPPVWVQRMNYHTDILIAWLSPSLPVMVERARVLEYVKGIVARSLGARLFPVGSFMLRTFLPDADIDATAFLCLGQEDNWFIKVNEALCLSALSTARASETDPNTQQIQRCVVKNVSFINAEVKIVKAVINNISVDISANQLPALYSASCFDDVDRFLGKHFLFKRSVLLVKAWCKYESERYSGGRGCCFGSKEGRLSSFCLNVMMTALFNRRAATIENPIQAFLLFLQAYEGFDWSKYALTVQGPVSAADLSPVDMQADDLLFWRGANTIPDSLFDGYRRRFVNACNATRTSQDTGFNEVAWANGHDHFYRRGLLNVLDPVWTQHNLNRSVTVAGATAVCASFREGFQAFLRVLQRAVSDEEALRTSITTSHPLAGGAQTQAHSNAKMLQRNCPAISELFNTSLETYCRGDGYRPDLGWKIAAHRPDVPRNLFETRQQDNEMIMSHGELVLANQVTAEALISLVVHILELKGPLPVGEIGKQLQEATGNPQLSHVLKDKYGGLKKFIEGIPALVNVGDDHPFNPHVYLNGQSPPSRVSFDSSASGGTAPPRRTPPTSPHTNRLGNSGPSVRDANGIPIPALSRGSSANTSHTSQQNGNAGRVRKGKRSSSFGSVQTQAQTPSTVQQTQDPSGMSLQSVPVMQVQYSQSLHAPSSTHMPSPEHQYARFVPSHTHTSSSSPLSQVVAQLPRPLQLSSHPQYGTPVQQLPVYPRPSLSGGSQHYHFVSVGEDPNTGRVFPEILATQVPGPSVPVPPQYVSDPRGHAR